jgi:hypothetical protein
MFVICLLTNFEPNGHFITCLKMFRLLDACFDGYKIAAIFGKQKCGEPGLADPARPSRAGDRIPRSRIWSLMTHNAMRHIRFFEIRNLSPKPMQPRQIRETFIPVEPKRTYSMAHSLQSICAFADQVFTRLQPLGRGPGHGVQG